MKKAEKTFLGTSIYFQTRFNLDSKAAKELEKNFTELSLRNVL